MSVGNGTGNRTGDGGAPEWLRRLGETFAPGEVGAFLFDLFRFSLLLVAGFFLGRILRRTYHGVRRQAPTSGQIFVGKIIQSFLVILAGGIGLSVVYEVDPWSLIAAAGLVSLALGFGLQNTVANLAAGVGLTLDKPFDVGDRIRVGETWGDVVSIGLRSTRILTVKGEHVVVPNSLLDKQEVWNFTHHESDKIRVDIPVGITYASSIPLAEHLALEVARGTPHILAYPEPVVRFRGFGEHAVDLELRCWIDHARDRPAIQDRLIRGIKEAFDKEGVQFPFPQRTVSYLSDLVEPAPTPDFLHAVQAQKPVVVACIRDRPVDAAVARVVEFVDRLDARLVALHVRPPKRAVHQAVAQAAVNQYLERAQRTGVPARGRLEVGDFPDVVARVAREVGARLVVLGDSSRHRLGVAWHRHDFQAARERSPVPVVVLDVEGPLDEKEVQRWADRIRPAEPPEEADLAAPPGADGPPVGGKAPGPP